MATIHITCLDVDDYSHEDVLELDIRETETIGNLREIIKSSKLSFDNAKSFEVLKVNSSYNEINEKLAFLEDNSSVNIKKVLGGEELNATDKISEVFETEKNCIVLIEPRTLALLSNDVLMKEISFLVINLATKIIIILSRVKLSYHLIDSRFVVLRMIKNIL